ncbi:hypothetical protein GCM10007857_63740 [Bradyrhizobium iriomotense]|uniref:Branched-chain amino acid ATP-binding cassette transporter C-terminal domain-containing protein n=1 Tax=Bradyrhizobium iriomotense TaxID=441950 RepID=A0ABQ6B5L3_9BRAD|nr:hypothetical protein [Bradyrhizobium iriomotense]GLR89660.1 hypothetical protein GCM10007857_63740 [Bradyrhizobium iriomotense]
MTIVWIEHILHALLDMIDRLVCMNAGTVIAEGDSAAAMADPAVRRAYLGVIRMTSSAAANARRLSPLRLRPAAPAAVLFRN